MKSRINFIVIILVFLIIQLGCTPQESKVVDLKEDALVGTWRLIKTIEIGHEDSTNRRDNEEKFYIKHINNSHFVWFEYDRVNNQLLGTGGGTYTLEDNIYTENIHFYYPPGSNELGQAIPFKASMNEDGQWRHTGYAKLMEFDPVTAENVMVDSAIIDELWERVEMEPDDDTNGDLIGTWEFVNFLNESDSTFSEYPPFYGILKILTPTHFTWIQYNTEGDEIYGMGEGPYTVSGDQYVEHIQVIHPQEPQKIGADAVYTWELKDPNLWHINGTIQIEDEPESRIENWERYEELEAEGETVAKATN